MPGQREGPAGIESAGPVRSDAQSDSTGAVGAAEDAAEYTANRR